MAIDAEGRWVAGIGDPSVVGWVTTAAYGVAALLALRNASAARRNAAPAGFWWLLALLMLLLGINKQLDLQTWFGQTGRAMALSQGWYDRRRAAQGVFIVLLGLGALAAVAAARHRFAALWPQYRGVFVGVVLLLVFIVMRAASFHHIDEIFSIDVGATRLHRAMEIVGVSVVAWACARWHATHGRRTAMRGARP